MERENLAQKEGVNLDGFFLAEHLAESIVERGSLELPKLKTCSGDRVCPLSESYRSSEDSGYI